MWLMCVFSMYCNTSVAPLIPREGHNKNNLSAMDMPKFSFPHIFNTFWTADKQTINLSTKDKMAGPITSFVQKFHSV